MGVRGRASVHLITPDLPNLYFITVKHTNMPDDCCSIKEFLHAIHPQFS
jgi:hypothetical protein